MNIDNPRKFWRLALIIVFSSTLFNSGCGSPSFDVAASNPEDLSGPDTEETAPRSDSDSDLVFETSSDVAIDAAGYTPDGDVGPDSFSIDSACPSPLTHDDGLGGTFLDCAPRGAFSAPLAIAAARSARPSPPSYILVVPSPSTTTSTTCGLDPETGAAASVVRAFSSPSCASTCDTSSPPSPTCEVVTWIYTGPLAGRVYRRTDGVCACVGQTFGTWD